MQFSLRSRFRGAFLGAALGHIFGTIALNQAQSGNPRSPQKFNLLDVSQLWQFPVPAAELNRGQTKPASSIPMLVRDLIEPSASLPSPIASLPQTAIDFLPLILFCHESREQLQSVLLSRSANLPACRQAELLAIGQTVSLILQEQFLPNRLLPLLTIEQTGHSPSSETIANQLQQVQSWLVDSLPLAMLPSVTLLPLSAALYGFLKMPASLPIALLQTLRLTPDPEAAALVGLLAGSHLSEAGLPIDWRMAINRVPMPAALQNHYYSAILNQLWGVASGAALLDLADQLWAAWSGVYQPQQHPPQSTVTAVPRLVRPR